MTPDVVPCGFGGATGEAAELALKLCRDFAEDAVEDFVGEIDGLVDGGVDGEDAEVDLALAGEADSGDQARSKVDHGAVEFGHSCIRVEHD